MAKSATRKMQVNEHRQAFPLATPSDLEAKGVRVVADNALAENAAGKLAEILLLQRH